MKPILWSLAGLCGLAIGAVACSRGYESTFAGRPVGDVVLVTIDTLRWDAPGYTGKSRAATPVIDRIAKEGVVYTHAHAQSVVTLPSHTNILTGLYPYQHGVRDNAGFRLDAKFPTLATILRGRGFATAAVIGAFPLDSRFGLARGFDLYDQSYPEGAHEYDFVMSERPAIEVVAAGRQWLAASSPGRPRFLWLHLYDCHAPYAPPAPFDRQYSDAPYYGEVAAVDAALGPLLEDLERKATPTLLVLTGDHGEALGDHGERSHGLFAYEATLKVPLLLWCPSRLRHRTDARLARHIDIAPTILQATGAPVPAGWPGTSLLSKEPPRSSYFEAVTTALSRGWAPLRGVVSGSFKAIDLPLPELYDLASDPGEQSNLASTNRRKLAELRTLLPREYTLATSSPIVHEEWMKLQNLGYLGGRAAPKDHYEADDDPKNLVGLDSKIHEVVTLYQTGRFEEAERVAEGLVRARPTMSTGYEFLSFLQARAGNDAGAIATLEAARAHRLLDEALTTRLALLYKEVGRARAGLDLLAPLLPASVNPDVWNAVGILRAGAGQFDDSMAAFRRALAVDPKNAIAWQNIGLTEIGRNRPAAALDALEKALAQNPRLPRAWNGKGVALDGIGREKEAISAWKTAVSLDPELLDAWFNLGVVSIGSGDSDGARRAFTEFLRRATPARRADIVRAESFLNELNRRLGVGVH